MVKTEINNRAIRWNPIEQGILNLSPQWNTHWEDNSKKLHTPIYINSLLICAFFEKQRNIESPKVKTMLHELRTNCIYNGLHKNKQVLQLCKKYDIKMQQV